MKNAGNIELNDPRETADRLIGLCRYQIAGINKRIQKLTTANRKNQNPDIQNRVANQIRYLADTLNHVSRNAQELIDELDR